MFKGLCLVALILLSLCSVSHAVPAIGHVPYPVGQGAQFSNFSNGNSTTEYCETECVVSELFGDGSNSTSVTTNFSNLHPSVMAVGNMVFCHQVCFVYTNESGVHNWTDVYVTNNTMPSINIPEPVDKCWDCGWVTVPTCYYVNGNDTNSTDVVTWTGWNETDGAMEAPGNGTWEKECVSAYSHTCYDNCTYDENPMFSTNDNVVHTSSNGDSSNSSNSSNNGNNGISIDTVYHTLKFPVTINGEDFCDAGSNGEDALVKAVMDALFVDTSASDWDNGMVSLSPGKKGGNVTADYVFSIAIKASNEDAADIILGGMEFNFENSDFANNVYDNLVEQGGELPCSLSGASDLEFGDLTLECAECSGSVATQVAYTALALLVAAIQIFV